MIRLGLCCIFINEPVKFHYTTVKIIKSINSREKQLEKLSGIALENSEALIEAVKTCHKLGIRAFRVLSQILPVYTHPECGYELEDLPQAGQITGNFALVKKFASENDIRLSFHPDQFVILASPRPEVVSNSIRELEYQCMVAEMIGADNVNIHMGGVYGDKQAALRRFVDSFNNVSDLIKRHLTLENDDISYTPEDLYPVCMKTGIPMIYDVHHHRCKPDRFNIYEASMKSVETFQQAGREPHFHISSPRNGWDSSNPRIHAEYINIDDFPEEWLEGLPDFTLDIEAVDKELAVKRLQMQLKDRGVELK